MKKIIFILSGLFMTAVLMAQDSPLGMRYQAVTRDLDGSVIANEAMVAKIEMLTNNEVDKVYYQEMHEVTSNQFGLLNLTIGEGEVTAGNYNKIPWSEQNVWVRISIKRHVDSGFTIVTTNKLYSVPYAHYATKAGSVGEEQPPSSPNSPAPSGGSVWSLRGNKNADNHSDPPVLGTTDPIPVVFITNDTERMRIHEDGTISIAGDLDVGEDAIIGMDLTVKQDVFLNTDGGSTSIDGPTTIGGPDMNSATFTGSVRIDKDLHVGGELKLDSSLQVQGEATLDSNLTVNGETALNGITTIGGAEMGLATFTGDVQMDKNLDVDGVTTLNDSLTVKAPTTFDINVTGLQTDQTSYPVLIKGSDQGLAIDLTPATDQCLTSHRGNNYISFWRDGEQKGRIEGMGRADLDPTGLMSLIVNMISDPSSGGNGLGSPFGISFTDPFTTFASELESLVVLDEGHLPELVGGSLPSMSGGTRPSICWECPSFDRGAFPTLNTGSFPTLTGGALPSIEFGAPTFSDPFSGSNLSNTFNGLFESFNPNNSGGDIACIVEEVSPAQTAWALIKSPLMDANMYPNQADATNFESQIFSNYTLDVLLGGISTLSSAVTFLTSLASVLDPEDVFSEGVDLVANITSLVIYGSYADINIGVAYESGSGDYAEWLMRADANELIQPGDLVGVIGGRISKKFNHADKFMVVSTSPLLLGNMPASVAEEQVSEKVAFMGQVPVKVMGDVNIGDYILPSGSGDGIATAVSPDDMLARDYQRIVGVAWEESSDDGFMHLINVAVGLNHNDMSKMIEQMQFTLNHIQSAIQEIDPSFVAHNYDVTIDEFGGSTLDYNVSATHPSKIAGYFENAEYQSDAELLADVKDRMVNQAGIDLSSIPLIEYIFEDTDRATSLAQEFQVILDDMISVRDGMLQPQGE